MQFFFDRMLRTVMLFRVYNDDLRYIFARTCEHVLLVLIGGKIDFQSRRTIPLIFALLLLHLLSRAISNFILDTVRQKVKEEETILYFLLAAGAISLLRLRKGSCWSSR